MGLYRLSEVVKRTGVSRRALQGYERMGLVRPTDKTESGYWLYDDEAIGTIICIKMMSCAGYTRKQIKEILDHGYFTLENIDQIVENLEDKKKRIENILEYMRVYRIVYQEYKRVLQDKISPELADDWVARILPETSVSIEEIVDYMMEDEYEFKYHNIMLVLFEIVMHYDDGIDDPNNQEKILRVFNFFKNEGIFDDEKPSEEFIQMLEELADEGFYDNMDKMLGVNGRKIVREAAQEMINNYKLDLI
ncbi:MerR family transcriptional regulator [Eubacterium xylanophilum]|uniref:MerR family transcriptional regulator n=1 Tax=Eubacterium xylanophilum TaxID=39497 RepID=UPI00047A9D5E|nr:MerR family transcriptional regulator [Eubacterium xylanophilum]